MTYEEILCDANNLYDAYHASIRGSKWKETTQKFMLNYMRRIFKIQDQLQNRTLTNGKTVEFELNERGRPRPITSLCIDDRIVRHVLCDNVLLPAIRRKIIYGNGASLKGRGTSFTRKHFEIDLRRYYQKYGNEGYILFGDFTKFYDNIIHDIAKEDFLKLLGYDEFVSWLLDLIFQGFEVDVSYMSHDEYNKCMSDVFNKLEYRKSIPKSARTGRWIMKKSVEVGDQIAQEVGIYYPHPIDNYIKYVRSQKFYQRYMDDWYIMSPSKEGLVDILERVTIIAKTRGIHINNKKTRIIPINKWFTFLQIRYKLTDSGKILKKINPKRVTAMRRKIKKLAVKVEKGEITYEQVENTFRSWMCDHYKLISKTQRKNLINLFEELYDKTIVIMYDGKKKKMIFMDRKTSGGECGGRFNYAG